MYKYYLKVRLIIQIEFKIYDKVRLCLGSILVLEF